MRHRILFSAPIALLLLPYVWAAFTAAFSPAMGPLMVPMIMTVPAIAMLQHRRQAKAGRDGAAFAVAVATLMAPLALVAVVKLFGHTSPPNCPGTADLPANVF